MKPSRDNDEAQPTAVGHPETLSLLLRLNPVAGTQLGLAGRHDFELPPMGEGTRRELLQNLQHTVRRLCSRQDDAASVDDSIDAEMAAAGVRAIEISEDRQAPLKRNPGVYVDAVVSAATSLLNREDLDVTFKSEALLSRLRGIPALLAQGAAQIARPVRVLLDNAIGDVAGTIEFYTKDVADFIQAQAPGSTLPSELLKAQQACVSSMNGFKEHVEKLSHGADDAFALGREGFESLLNEVHFLDMSSCDLRDMGLEACSHYENELAKSCRKSFGHVRWWEEIPRLSETHPPLDGLLGEYESTLSRAREFITSHGLVDLGCTAKLMVKPTPPYATTNLPFAAYLSAPVFAREGTSEYWVTVPDKKSDPTELASLLSQHNPGLITLSCIHEAFPGHHVQFSHAALVCRPLRHWFGSNVYSEGWALYSEELMRSQGFVADVADGPLLELFLLRAQLWRAVRILLDVGLHCEGMSRADAERLLVDKHVLTERSAAAEVMYSCSAPTQPMSYMVGKQWIEKLVAVMLSSGSTMQEAHARILKHGALPPGLLERALGQPAIPLHR